MDTPKFTKSKDGVNRCTLKVEFRLNKTDYELLKRYAEAEGYDGVADVIRSEGSLAVEALLFEIRDKY